MSDVMTTPQPPAPSGRRWPIMIVSLLLLNVAVCATTVTLSLRNPAEIEPDYYSRGLEWDASRVSATVPNPLTNSPTDTPIDTPTDATNPAND